MREQLRGARGHGSLQPLGKCEAGGREVRKDGLGGGEWANRQRRRRDAEGPRQHTTPGPSDWGSALFSSFILNFKKNHFKNFI